MHSATSLLSANLLAHTHHLPVYCFRYYYCCCCSLSHIFWTIQVLFGFHSHSFWGLHLIIQILVAWKSPFWQMMKARRSLESLENGISQQNVKKVSCSTVLTLAYQSLGVVYGDLSTSPLYVYKTTFSGKLSLHEDDEEIFGVLSFIFWTFTLIALFKYVFIVISANDNGEGGTFALYSLLCRHARLSILPNQEETDEALSSYAIERPVETWQSSILKSFFEKHPKLCKGLLIFVLLGTCMAIDDGIFTPAISVLSAVSGVKVKFAGLHENYIVIISCIILVGLFSLQHHGTHRVAFMFAPVVTAWLLCIGGIGAYNIFKWNPCILHALSPSYMLKFLRSTGTEGWVALGGVVLSITGVEAMFADLGHFSALSIKIAFTFLVYPCLVLAYLGEAAFLSRHHQDIQRSFYKAIPEPIFWPVFIVATFAAVIGSQAAISATFSIISQCCALSCFPKVKIVHTSSKICGQIYIPEINWMLMCLCLSVTIGLRDTNMVGHAYGLAVTTIMFVTTCLMAMVMVIVWKQNIFTTIAFMVFFGSVELLYFSAALFRVPDGGWVPLVLSSIFMSVMFLWNYGTLKKHQFDVENKVSMTRILSLGPSLGMVRVPGIGLVYTNLVTGVPAVFGHFITNLPAFHQVVIFICIKSVQVPYIGEKDRFLVRRVGPKEYSMFKCIVRYGYKDLQQENYDFENRLVCTIIQFVEREGQGGELQPLAGSPTEFGKPDVEARDLPEQALPSYPDHGEEMVRSIHDLNTMEAGNGHLEGSSLKDESMQILRARESGIAHILGHSYAQAKKSSSVFRKFAIDVVYAFLSKNCREPDVSLDVPYTSLLEVGMIYYV